MKIRKMIMPGILFCLAIASTAFITPEKGDAPVKEKGGMSFAEFLSHFEKTELPFAIDLEEVNKDFIAQQAKSSKTKIMKKKAHRPSGSTLSGSEYIPESRAMFSRMGPPHIEPLARFYPSEKLIAVIYSVQRRFGVGLKQYSMMVYDLKGKMVFHKDEDLVFQGFELAHSNYEQTVTCRIDEKGNVWRNTYKNVWEKDIQKKGIKGNHILDYKLTDTEIYKINEIGDIVQLNEIPLNDRASLK